MILGITGHRRFDSKEIFEKVVREISRTISELNPSEIISGFALGTDQIAARIAISLKIPLHAAIPFKGQEALWEDGEKAHYSELLKAASKITYVSSAGYAGWKMQRENIFIVDNSDQMLAVLDPKIKKSGTLNCVEYARSINKLITYITPND